MPELVACRLPPGQTHGSRRRGFLAESGGTLRMRVLVTPDHNLALDLVRTTEAAALAAGAGSAGTTRLQPTRPPWTPCGCFLTPYPSTGSSSSERVRRTRRRCSTTARPSVPVLPLSSTWRSTRSTVPAWSPAARPTQCPSSRSLSGVLCLTPDLAFTWKRSPPAAKASEPSISRRPSTSTCANLPRLAAWNPRISPW